MNFLWSSKSKSSKEGNLVTESYNASTDNIANTSGNSSNVLPQIQTIIDFPKIFERRFGESLGYRTNLLQKLAKVDKLGIGPPDLVHITLYDKFHQEEVGEYFYITGVDISSESMAITLLKLLKSGQPEGSNSNMGNISTYCSVNVFSKVDIRIRYEYDNKQTYQVNAIDCLDGTSKVKLSDEIWEETFVSCCIRSLIINKDVERKLPGLMEYPLGIDVGGAVVCKRIIKLLCKYLPRCFEVGWDSTKNLHPTVFHNYLTEALLIFLTVTPNLIDFTIDILRDLSINDSDNELFYSCALILVLNQHGEKDNDLIETLNKTLKPLFPLLNSLRPRDTNSFQLLNCIAELLNLQTQFLLKYGDNELALSTAIKSTEVALDSFNSWYYLAKCYITLRKFDRALLAINSMPNLPFHDKIKKIYYNESPLYDYYTRPLCNYDTNNYHSSSTTTNNKMTKLNSNEIDILGKAMSKMKESKLRAVIFGRIVMPNESKRGFSKEIWEDDSLKLGPIYGPQSCNSINFVSPREVESITDIKLLTRNSMAKQYSWSQTQVYNLLIELILGMGWNELLKLRTELFVMENEYCNNNSSNNNRNIADKNVPISIREKRICERWLDQLFLDIYEDLAISKQTLESKDIRCSGLEWQLMGLTMLRTWEWTSAIACLRTSIRARFDPISTNNLLALYLRRGELNEPIALDDELVLDLLIRNISYQARFYNTFQITNFQVLTKLCDSMGLDAVKSQVHSSRYVETAEEKAGIVAYLDSMLAWITQTLPEDD